MSGGAGPRGGSGGDSSQRRIPSSYGTRRLWPFAARSPAKRARAYATGIATGFAFAALLFFVHEHRKAAADAGVVMSASASTSTPQPAVTAVALAPTSAPVTAPTTGMVVLRVPDAGPSILACRAVELARNEILGDELRDFAQSARRAILSGIPVGINADGINGEEDAAEFEERLQKAC